MRSWNPRGAHMPWSIATSWVGKLGTAGWATFSHTGPILGFASWLCHMGRGELEEWFCQFCPPAGHSSAILCLGMLNTVQREAWRGALWMGPGQKQLQHTSVHLPPQIWEISEATWFCRLLPEVSQPGGCTVLSLAVNTTTSETRSGTWSGTWRGQSHCS